MHYGEYLASDPVQDGEIQNPMSTGEAMKLVPEQLKCEHTSISWREIAGMRGIPIHAYFGSVVRAYRMLCGMGSRNSRLQSVTIPGRWRPERRCGWDPGTQGCSQVDVRQQGCLIPFRQGRRLGRIEHPAEQQGSRSGHFRHSINQKLYLSRSGKVSCR